MPIEIVVPDLGESIIEATVANWLKNEGEQVSVGEAMVELETDKVDLEVGAPQDGVLSKIEVQAGQDVKVGEVLGIMEARSDEKEDLSQPPKQTTSEKEPEPVQPPAAEQEGERAAQESPVSSQSTEESTGTERATPVA